MAIWQFEFNIIHKSKKDVNEREIDYYDKVISWQNHDIKQDSLYELEINFPIEKSWSDDIIQYGNKEKTNLQLFYEKRVLLEISCGIDLRNIEKKEFDGIVDFIKVNDAAIFFNKKIYEFSKNQLVKLIMYSDAYNFCKDPLEFLKGVEIEQNSTDVDMRNQ